MAAPLIVKFLLWCDVVTAIMVVKEALDDKKRGSLGRQIGSLPQESIGDDELAVSVPGMRSGTIDHSAKQPAAIPRGDRSQLVVAGAPRGGQGLGQHSGPSQQRRHKPRPPRL